jgi:hypothetical protein
LGVGEWQAHDETGDGVEATAEELAIEGLALGLAVFLEPMAMSAPCLMAAKRRSASSMGAERSASVKSATSPRAWSIPERTL